MNSELKARILAYNAAKQAVETKRNSLQNRISAAKEKLTALQENSLFKYLGIWAKTLISEILDALG